MIYLIILGITFVAGAVGAEYYLRYIAKHIPGQLTKREADNILGNYKTLYGLGHAMYHRVVCIFLFTLPIWMPISFMYTSTVAHVCLGCMFISICIGAICYEMDVRSEDKGN